MAPGSGTQEFDRIVVGAGSAGCVIARRLVDAGRRVALIEAGGPDYNPAIHQPNRSWELWNSPEDWAYSTEPRQHSLKTSLFWPRGKVLGGPSALNGMIYVRGRPRRPACRAMTTLLTVITSAQVNRPLLTVITSAQVNRLVFDGAGRAAGVRLSRPGLVYAFRTDPADSVQHPVLPEWTATELRCSGDVIVCGGAIGTPQLLLLSGIGPADGLRPLGIDVRADLPGVGANLHDHALATLLYESARKIPEGKANNLEAHFFAKSDPGLTAPDLQPLMSHFPMPVEGYQQLAYGDGYAIVAGIIRPLSRGRLWLRSADPAEHPVIDPHHLEEKADVRALLASLKLSREVGQAKALSELRAREIAPGPDARTDEELIEYGMRNLITYHHQVGTCKMGIDNEAVLSPADLRVYGIDGLRVADASAMPSVTSGNTNAPTIMIAERCAEFALGG